MRSDLESLRRGEKRYGRPTHFFNHVKMVEKSDGPSKS